MRLAGVDDGNLFVANRLDKDGDLEISIPDGERTCYLPRLQVQVLRDHLTSLLGDDPSTTDTTRDDRMQALRVAEEMTGRLAQDSPIALAERVDAIRTIATIILGESR